MQDYDAIKDAMLKEMEDHFKPTIDESHLESLAIGRFLWVNSELGSWEGVEENVFDTMDEALAVAQPNDTIFEYGNPWCAHFDEKGEPFVLP
jgi:hypothetical protein